MNDDTITVTGGVDCHQRTHHAAALDDAVDAEAAARKVLSGEATVIPKDTTGAVEAIRQLQVARHSAVKARSVALCQPGAADHRTRGGP